MVSCCAAFLAPGCIILCLSFNEPVAISDPGLYNLVPFAVLLLSWLSNCDGFSYSYNLKLSAVFLKETLLLLIIAFSDQGVQKGFHCLWYFLLLCYPNSRATCSLTIGGAHSTGDVKVCLKQFWGWSSQNAHALLIQTAVRISEHVFA